MAQKLASALILSFGLWLGGTAHAASPVVAATPPQPKWSMLTQQQQATLAPLASDWDNLENYRRKKWLGIAARYAKMSPEEQQRTQEKMREWASLPPDIRRDAREKFKEYSKLSPEAKAALRQRWQDYKQQQAGDAPAAPATTEEKR